MSKFKLKMHNFTHSFSSNSWRMLRINWSILITLLYTFICISSSAFNNQVDLTTVSLQDDKSEKSTLRKNLDNEYGLNNIQYEKSLLWEISGNGLKQKSYLFGTIHKICHLKYRWHPHMDQALKSSDLLVMEVDVKELQEDFLEGENSFDIIDSFYQVLEDENNLAIDTLASATKAPDINDIPEKYLAEPPLVKSKSKNKKYFDSNIDNIYVFQDYHNLSITPQTIDQIYIYDLITKENEYTQNDWVEEVRLESIPYCNDSSTSYELELLKLSQQYQIPTDQLETIFDQFKMLTQMTAENDADYGYEFHELVQKNELDDAYVDQDITLLFDLMKRSGLNPSQLKTLLNERNHKWIDLMNTMMQNNTIFFAVGAGHLGGENGLIQLLIKQGYTVTPILK